MNWKDKAHRIIGNLSRQSYLAANRLSNGTMRKRHVPYVIPELAQDLIACLNTNDEHKAKAIFLSYDGLKAI